MWVNEKMGSWDHKFTFHAMHNTRYSIRVGIICIAILFIHSLGCGFPYSQPGVLKVSYPQGDDSFQFIVYGDNRPNPLQKGLNAIVQGNFVKEVMRVKPRFVVNTGDLVWSGISEDGWREFELQTLSPIRQAGIPYFPAIGNHELRYGPFGLSTWWQMGWKGILQLPLLPVEVLSQLGFPGISNQRGAIDNFFEWFPQLGRKEAYAFRYGNSQFVFLNTESSTAPDSAQGRFLQAQFEKVKADASYRFFFMVFHRPSYTINTEHSPRPKEQQLATVLEGYQQRWAREGRTLQIVVLMGHNHIYYRTRRNGVIYIITGGGGALLHNVRPNGGTIPGDAWGVGYHYLLVTIHGSEIGIETIPIPTFITGKSG